MAVWKNYINFKYKLNPFVVILGHGWLACWVVGIVPHSSPYSCFIALYSPAALGYPAYSIWKPDDGTTVVCSLAVVGGWWSSPSNAILWRIHYQQQEQQQQQLKQCLNPDYKYRANG